MKHAMFVCLCRKLQNQSATEEKFLSCSPIIHVKFSTNRLDRPSSFGQIIEEGNDKSYWEDFEVEVTVTSGEVC
ncbi:Uncharacterized protein TCM_042271 [Theobroma cacao]|uniref:Uncharacterized protein n=1 Tax=Theobroma cacao TaxID=3641 RepID=A0A061H0F2_THECC|nr:Uncharacterized protein TCM_042271 [Theobroma cacao]